MNENKTFQEIMEKLDRIEKHYERLEKIYQDKLNERGVKDE